MTTSLVPGLLQRLTVAESVLDLLLEPGGKGLLLLGSDPERASSVVGRIVKGDGITRDEAHGLVSAIA